jgi:hypothetical protein
MKNNTGLKVFLIFSISIFFIIISILIIIIILCICFFALIITILRSDKIYTDNFYENESKYRELVILVQNDQLQHNDICIAPYAIPENMKEYFDGEDCVTVKYSDKTRGLVVEIGNYGYVENKNDVDEISICSYDSAFINKESCEKSNNECVEKCIKIDEHWYAGLRDWN